MSPFRNGTAILVTAIVAFAVVAAGCASRHINPAQEALTTSTESYEISVQKNGRLDVTLSSGAPVFQNAFSMVWLDGEKEPRLLPIDGRMGMRDAVHDRLGQGHSMTYRLNETELRVQAYPTKPFLTMQVAYSNTGRHPVKLKMLLPWCVGAPNDGGVFLGEGTDQSTILENGRLFAEGDDFPRLVTGQALSQWNLAILNPTTGRSLIAGFLTNDHAYTQIRVSRTPAAPADRFDQFRTECVFDPPIEVPPGGVVRSEILYLGINETSPLEGLDRFGHAMAVTNELEREKPLAPHGWDPWSTRLVAESNEASLTASVEALDARLRPHGWNHVTVGRGWQKAFGDWEPDPAKYPQGMKAAVDLIHAKGMTAGLWIDPFRVNVNSSLAQQHPDWLKGPSEFGKAFLQSDERILDVTVPDAALYVQTLFSHIRNDWGFDEVVAGGQPTLLMLAEGYSDATLTRTEVMRMGMKAIRDGFGAERSIESSGPGPITGVFANRMRIGSDTAPIWRKVPDRAPWGAIEAITNAARRFYMAPYMWTPDIGCVYFEDPAVRERWGMADQPPLTLNQSLAWLTAAAMTGGTITLGNDVRELSDQHVEILKRLLPVPAMPAKPVDLFTSETPRIWSMPVRGEGGAWHLVALFNWDVAAEQVVQVSLASLGLEPGALYTLYNYWGDTYHGVVNGEFEMNVPPGGVQLLGLRRFENRPMLLASARHFTQGALDVTSVEWDKSARRLNGAIETEAGTECSLRILVPAPYACTKVDVSVEPTPALELVGQMLKLRFPAGKGGKVAWSVQF